EGEDFRIRRAVGEVWVPGEKVLCLCADWKDTYAFLRCRANLSDADERVRLARWCQVHGLKQEALEEISAAVELEPNNREARSFQPRLSGPVAAPSAKSAPAPQASAPPPTQELPPVDLSSESLSVFNVRVQPILMNACARCHANNRGGEFRLMRAFQ